jgi:steroid 5-alpha reductase family enzyme
MDFGLVFWAVAVGIVALMVLTWAVSVPLRDVSIIDPVWPLGFVVAAWIAFAVGDGDPGRRWLLAGLVTIWGLRLSAHLFRRNIGKGEDPRYARMRARRPRVFWIRSLVTVFLLQGVLMWIVALPVQMGSVPDTDLGALAWIGVAVWAVGLYFEAVGDRQLDRFRADPANKGKVLDTGLWRYTRHPNYFGDFCVWWGIFLIAAETGIGALSIVGPILMSVLLIKVSGAALLEKDLASSRPGYAEYVRRTSGFFPRPPRR